MQRLQFISSATLGGLSISLLAQRGFAQDDSDLPLKTLVLFMGGKVT
ncbi:MAG: hypothetical protein RH917_06670 [Lacipirellulaceae bacterium]